MPSPRDIDRLKSEMEELFADLCQVRRRAGRVAFRPRVDVYRTESPPAVTVTVEIAGIDANEVAVAFADGVLVVSGTRRRQAGEKRVYQHIEIDYGPFERRIPITEAIDADAVEAGYDRGLLTIVLPIAPPRPRRRRVAVTRREVA